MDNEKTLLPKMPAHVVSQTKTTTQAVSEVPQPVLEISPKNNKRTARSVKGYLTKCRHEPVFSGRKISERANRTGQRYGRLFVVEDLGVIQGSERLWGCVCDCGSRVGIVSRCLRSGNTRSCRCLSLEQLSHGKNALEPGQSALNQLFYAYKKSARERGYEFSLGIEDFKRITQLDCYYCEAAPVIKFRAAKGTNGNYIGNGVDRVDNSLGYQTGNVRPCCTHCNIAKWKLSESEFYAWLFRAYSVAAKRARFEHGEKG